MEHPQEIPETPRTVVTRDSLKLPVAPFPREEFRASDSELVRPWSTAEWVAVATGDAAVQLPDGTRWELLEVHQIYVNARDAEDETGVSTALWRYRCAQCGDVDEHHPHWNRRAPRSPGPTPRCFSSRMSWRSGSG
jgi:hypothetical protein